MVRKIGYNQVPLEVQIHLPAFGSEARQTDHLSENDQNVGNVYLAVRGRYARNKGRHISVQKLFGGGNG
ncbi:hypothetical protein [Geotalea uraniireducens]|uniref:hypothetical protein n=1 Tax=Geotalea uraniireducens TaxID=351604 RepID=UPI0003049A99|nr:hypothetical protein [Geotalea uraniireducens]